MLFSCKNNNKNNWFTFLCGYYSKFIYFSEDNYFLLIVFLSIRVSVSNNIAKSCLLITLPKVLA